MIRLPARVSDVNVWQVAMLSIPIARTILFLTGLTPAQVAGQVLPLWLQAFSLIAVGLGALVALVGVLRQLPIVERTGLMLLWPTITMYAITLVIADHRKAWLSFLIYVATAAACVYRQRQITKAMRLTNSVLA